MKGNILPELTWRWLNVNDVDVDLKPSDKEEKEAAFDAVFEDMKYGISEEVLKKNRSEAQLQLVEAEETVHLSVEEEYTRLGIEIPEGQDTYLVIDNAKSGPSNLLLQVYGRENSHCTLVLLQRNEEAGQVLTNLVSKLEKGAKLDLIHAELGAEKSVFNYTSNLVGEEAETKVNTIYLLGGEEKLDLFYLVNHIAPRTKSDLHVNGALMEKAKKSFRGTLDFKTGATGSVGAEEEYAVLLDETVHSVAVPLLLCTEDDVVGNHAASAGRLDEDVLNYIMSRGFSREQARALIVESKLTPTIDLIREPEIRKEIRDAVLRRMEVHDGRTEN